MYAPPPTSSKVPITLHLSCKNLKNKDRGTNKSDPKVYVVLDKPGIGFVQVSILYFF